MVVRAVRLTPVGRVMNTSCLSLENISTIYTIKRDVNGLINFKEKKQLIKEKKMNIKLKNEAIEPREISLYFLKKENLIRLIRKSSFCCCCCLAAALFEILKYISLLSCRLRTTLFSWLLVHVNFSTV